METKKEIRKRMLKLRRECLPEIRHDASGRIARSVLQHPWFAEASDIYAYADFDGEAETRALIETALREGKKIKQTDMVKKLQLLGVDISTFSYNRIEKGTQNPTVSFLLTCCKIFECDINAIFGM